MTCFRLSGGARAVRNNRGITAGRYDLIYKDRPHQARSATGTLDIADGSRSRTEERGVRPGQTPRSPVPACQPVGE